MTILLASLAMIVTGGSIASLLGAPPVAYFGGTGGAVIVR